MFLFDLQTVLLKKLKKIEKDIEEVHRTIAGIEGRERRSQWWLCGFPAGVSDRDVQQMTNLCGQDTTYDPHLPKEFATGVNA